MADGFNTDDMLDSYLLENQQLIENLQQIVLEQKDKDCFDEEAVHKLFRILHTIKGSSGFMMFDAITLVAHKLEDIFYVIRESHPSNVPYVQLVEHVLTVSDFITEELEKIQNGMAADGNPDEILGQLDVFLALMKEGLEADKKQEIQKREEAAQKFYIAPVATNTSNHFRITLVYHEGVSLVNRRAYKTVLALKEISEEVIYYPENLISDESCVEEIQKNGFSILIRTRETEADIREFFKKGYKVCRVEIEACTESEYEQGFEESQEEPFFYIDLDSSIEEIEARAERTQEQIMSESKKRNWHLEISLFSQKIMEKRKVLYEKRKRWRTKLPILA